MDTFPATRNVGKCFQRSQVRLAVCPPQIVPRNENRKGGGMMNFTYSDLIQTLELFVAVVALIIQSKRK